jgi:putative membrane protein
MIEGYRDHAANERTFLAWVRTGIAVIAFGLVIERFNLFVVTLARSSLGGEVHAPQPQLHTLAQRAGRYEGFAFIVCGLAIVVLATARFIRTTRLLDDPQPHSAKKVRAELMISAAIVLLVASYSAYLAFF